MTEKITKEKEKVIDRRINVLYKTALVCYMLPLLFLGLYSIMDREILFWKMFLLGMFPFGLLGLLFTIIGIIQSSRHQNYQKRSRGYYNLFLGIIVVAGGILGWMLLYMVAR